MSNENRETWAYRLWLNNDEGCHEAVKVSIKEIVRQSDDKEEAMTELASYLKGFYDDLWEKPSKEVLTMLRDIGSDGRIDFDEVAKSYEEEIDDAFNDKN